MNPIRRFFSLLAIAGLVFPAWGMGTKPAGDPAGIRIGEPEAEQDLQSAPRSAVKKKPLVPADVTTKRKERPQASPTRTAKAPGKKRHHVKVAKKPQSKVAKKAEPRVAKSRPLAAPTRVAQIASPLPTKAALPAPVMEMDRDMLACAVPKKTLAHDEKPIAEAAPVPVPVARRVEPLLAPPMFPVMLAAATCNGYMATAHASDPFRVR